MPNFSFEIVSEVDLQEVDNAVNQATKELSQRYDFKNSKASLAFDRKEKKITLIADDDFKLRALTDILTLRLAKRGVSIKSLNLMIRKRLLRGTCVRVCKFVWGLTRSAPKSLTV